MEYGAMSFAFVMLALVLSLPMSLFLTVLLHEVGHALAGVLSGYSFTMLRFFGIELLIKNRELRIRRTSFGVEGQCLVHPGRKTTQKEAERVVLGGCAASLFITLLMAACALFSDSIGLKVFSVCMTAFGVICILESAVPKGANDAATFLEIRRYGCGNYNKLMDISCAAAMGIHMESLPDSLFIPETVGGDMSRELRRLKQMRGAKTLPLRREG